MARLGLLLALLSVGLTHCEACSDSNQSSGLTAPPPETAETPAPAPAPTPPEENIANAPPTACNVEIPTFTDLSGAPITLPTEGPTTPTSQADTPHRAATFLTHPTTGKALLVWAKGAQIVTEEGVLQSTINATIHDLAAYRFHDTTMLMIGSARGLHLIPVDFTETGFTLATQGSQHLTSLGGVTQVTVIIAAKPLLPASATAVMVSLNTPTAEFTTLANYPPTRYFVTAAGEAYQWQNHCLVQLYALGDITIDDQPLRAVRVAADLHHAGLLLESRMTETNTTAPLMAAAQAALVETLPHMDSTSLDRLLTMTSHFAEITKGQRAAYQTIRHIDLHARTARQLHLTGLSHNDAILSDIAFYRGQIMVCGLLFNDQPLAALNLEQRFMLYPTLWPYQAAIASSDISSLYRSTLLLFDPANVGGTATTLTLPTMSGATLGPLYTSLAPMGNELYVIGPFGYAAHVTQVDTDPTFLAIAGAVVDGVPRDLALDPAEMRLVVTLAGAIEFAEISLSEKKVTQQHTPASSE